MGSGVSGGGIELAAAANRSPWRIVIIVDDYPVVGRQG